MKTLYHLTLSSLAFLALSGCLHPAKPYLDKALELSRAGFVAHPANTTARYSLMNTLPPGMITYRMGPDGKPIFVFADPIACGCVYMGDETAFKNLRKRNAARTKKHGNAPGDDDLSTMTAENHRDTTAWDWTIWSPAADPDNNQPRHMLGDSW